jgi:hypothetical protein
MKCLAVEENAFKTRKTLNRRGRREIPQRPQSIQGEPAHLLTQSSSGSSLDGC